jgi:hypothetical protein
VIVARIAKLVLAKVRTEDSVARCADDTFMVIAAGSTLAQVQALGERLRRELIEAKVTHRQQLLRFPSRVGVAALAHDPAGSIEELMRLALRRIDAPPAPAKPPPAPASRPLPEELEAALARLESADWGRLAELSPQVMQRLQKIAAKLRR